MLRRRLGDLLLKKRVSIKPVEEEGIAESTNKVIVSLFQERDGRIVGLEEIKKDGRVKIMLRALKGSNLETGMHEMAHAIRRLVLNREIPAPTRGISNKSLDAIENYYGVKDGQWTREQEEKFAEDLLKRMQRPPRTAPKTKLAKAMTRVMNYLTTFYKQVKSGALGVVPG